MRINWIFAKPSLAGGVKSNRLLAEAMVRRGHEVTIIHTTRKEPQKFALGYRLRRFGDWMSRTVTRSAIATNHHLESSTAAIRVVDGDIVSERDVPDADVSIATWWRTREWTEPWSAAKGVKAYFVRHYEVHGGDPDRVRATYRLPGPKFVIARWLQRLMADEFGDSNAVLVPNGVDRTQFHAPVRSKRSPQTVGVLYGRQAWKGASTAFEAIRLLQRSEPSINLVSFGRETPTRHHVPPANFHFHHRPAQHQIREIYARAECWVVPSISEGFGMPGIEAAACRCPLVVTRCGGPEDFVEEGWNGHVVPTQDPAAMADAIGRVLSMSDDAWMAMSRASFEMSLRFDWDRSAAILERALTRDTHVNTGLGALRTA